MKQNGIKSGERQQEDTFMPGISRKKHLRINQDSAKTLPKALPRFQADSGRANRKFLTGAPKILRRGAHSRTKRGFHFATGGPSLGALPPLSRRSLAALPPLFAGPRRRASPIFGFSRKIVYILVIRQATRACCWVELGLVWPHNQGNAKI